MNTFRSYKLKLPKCDSSARQARYDSDSRFSGSSVSSDNEDYTENRHLARDLTQPDMIDSVHSSMKFIPRPSSFYPMSAYHAAEQIADKINLSGYSIPLGLNPHIRSLTEVSESMYPHSINYNRRSSFMSPPCLPKSIAERKPIWNSKEHLDGFIARCKHLHGTLNIDGVSFPRKDEQESPDSKFEIERVKSVKAKALRKKSDPGIYGVACTKSRGCFICRYCARKFSYICHLKVHERVHTGEKPYTCEYCSHQFSQLGSLTVHMRIHTGAKPYQCGECWKKFRHVNSLRRHQRQVHNMTSEQIAQSIDKVKDAALMSKQLAVMNQSVGSPPAVVPYDFRTALQFCHFPLPWYDPNSIWSQSYRNMFLFGQNNENTDDNFEGMESDGNSTPLSPTEKSKPVKTWRPFEECTDDENEEDLLNHYHTEAYETSSPKKFNYDMVEKNRVEPSHIQQHRESNINDPVTIQHSPHEEQDSFNNSDTESKEQSSDGYASMDDEVSSCCPIGQSCSKRYKSHNQCNLVY